MFLSFFVKWSKEENSCVHRELSLGYFSEANQKQLTRNTPINIYRARLPGSKRLVVSDIRTLPPLPTLTLYKYLIDVVPEFGGDVS